MNAHDTDDQMYQTGHWWSAHPDTAAVDAAQLAVAASAHAGLAEYVLISDHTQTSTYKLHDLTELSAF